MFSLMANIEGLHNSEGIHEVYKYGHVTETVKESSSGILDKMIIDNAIPIDIEKKII